MKNINSHLLPKALLIGLFLFPILPLKISAILLILNLISGVTLYYFRFKENKLQKVNYPVSAVLMSSLSILYFAFFIFSDFPEVAWFHFEKKLALIAAPTLFFLLRKVNFQIDKKLLFTAYILAANLLSVLTIAVFIYSLFHFDFYENNFVYQVRTLNEKITNLHPTYLGIHLFSTTFLALYLFQIKNFSKLKKWLLISIVITIVGGLLSGARAPLLAFILGITLYIIQHKSISKKVKLSSLGGALVLGFLLFKIPVIGDRFQGIIDAIQFNFTNPNAVDSLQRYWVYACDYQTLKGNWLFGVGTGDIQNHLNYCYELIDAKIALKQELNTHNEYANIWIGTGMFGFTIFLAFLLSTWNKFKLWISRAIFLLFTVVCLTENLLERQQGVFFVALFFSLFIFYENDNTNSNSNYPTSI